MPDETYRLEIQDNLNDVASRAQSAKKAVDDLSASLDKAGSSGHSFPPPGQTIPLNEMQSQVEKISAAQDAWAQSTMNHAEKVSYLRLKVSQMTEGTDDWYRASTQLNNELKKEGDELSTIANNFSGLLSAGRGMAELGRGASIIGQLVQDKDVANIGRAITAVGDLTMMVGRLQQMAKQGMGTLAGVIAGATGAVAGLAIYDKVIGPSQQTYNYNTGQMQANTGGNIFGQTASVISYNLTMLVQGVDAANKAFIDTARMYGIVPPALHEISSAAHSAAIALVDYNNAIFDQKRKLDKMDEGTLGAASKMFGLMGGATSAFGMLGIKTPYNELGAYAQSQAGIARERNTPAGQLRQAISEGNVGTIDRMFPTNAMDLTKYTQQEITQAKLMSVAATQSELQALKSQAQALGLNKDEVNAVVKLRQDEIDAMRILVTLQGQSSYLTGSEANHLQEMLSEIKTQQKQETANFNFQRLSNVSSAQFPQLQALASMYNAMLTRLGSPERSETQNLLLSDGTFKTMNTRMTALQLALEDLTKVEKAQLSGTWNLPAGATALVPISSLDLQRWNSKGSGMPDLSELLGATNRSGEMVSTSQQTAATRIVDAIHQTFSRMGLPTSTVDKAQSVSEAVTAARNVLRGEDAQTRGEFYDKWAKGDNPMVYKFTDALSGLFLNSQRDYVHQRELQTPLANQLFKAATPPTSVSVSALPIKANLTAQVNVLMNGSVIARALMPLMFDMLTRLTASTGYRQQGVQR